MVYDLLLSAPGMTELVKVDWKLNRKMVLLLVELIRDGLASKALTGVLSVMEETERNEIAKLLEGLLEKGGLSEMDKQLKLIEKGN